MIEIPIRFKNFDNKEVTETFNFHLSYPEIAELESLYPEGFVEHFKSLIRDEKDISTALEFLKLLMMKSVGQRSENGRRFVKTDDVRDDFEQCGAYSALFIMLATQEFPPEKFFNGIMPADLHEKADAIKAKLTVDDKSLETSNGSTETEKNIHQYTLEELLEMPDAEFKDLHKKNKGSLPQPFLVAAMQRLTRD